MRHYAPLIRKDSSVHMHGLAVHVKEGLPFARDVSLENSADSYLCFQLDLLHSMSYFFFFLYRSPFSSLCTVFDSISSNIDGQIAIFWPSKNFKNLIKFLFPFKFKLLFPGIGLFKLHKCKVSQHDLHFSRNNGFQKSFNAY